MQIENIKKNLLSTLSEDFYVYPDSFRFTEDFACFILKDSHEKYLGVIGPEKIHKKIGLGSQFGRDISIESINGFIIKFFKRNDKNLKKLLNIFPELNPSPLGVNTSFGFGDRLGLANAAHIKVIKKRKEVLPVLAQQSVRELLKTEKDFKTIVAQSTWNILQEGYQGKWGADADHIKDEEYFIKAVEAGMTMFTLDTLEYLDEAVLNMTSSMVKSNYDLSTGYIKRIKKQYLDKKIELDGNKLYFNEDILIRLALIYGEALEFTQDIFQFLSGRLNRFDFEVSFDETNTTTTPEAHYFIVNEMRRSNIDFTSLALRFPGTFEKGIDYLGDIDEFDRSIKIHGIICRKLGNYKLSLHSGSDKFSIYPSFARNTQGVFHIKTSGTSWLEAVRVVASIDPPFFRELFTIAMDSFDENKKVYHLNLDKDILPTSIKEVADKELSGLIDDRDLRRVFHIAYGAILEKEKERLMKLLLENEQKHYEYLLKNFKKHFDAL